MDSEFLRTTGSDFTLWGLVHSLEAMPSDGMPDETFYIKFAEQGGVLTFPSALDAEIYCQRLSAAGMDGWRRQRLEQIDLAKIMAAVPQADRRLMLALGFFASDANVLLLDEDQTLITALLPVPFDMQHSLHGVSQLRLKAEVPDFIHAWWEKAGGFGYANQINSLEGWTDHALKKCASEALGKAPLTGLKQYNKIWQNVGAGFGDECALFVPDTGEWRFSTLGDERNRSIHCCLSI